MRISNFELVETKGSRPTDWVYIANVDMEEGVLWWKTKKTREIRREFAGFWYFSDTGAFTPVFQVEKLARLWTAKTGQRC